MVQETRREISVKTNLWWLSVPAILALAAVLFFARLAERPFWGPESRWAEVAREMRISGNYFWPTINGRVHFGKPLLSYWLIAGAASVLGGLNEVAARLPSAACALLGVALMILLARRLYGYRTGVLAGIILATSYSYAFYARLAAADMATVTGVLAALTLYFYQKDKNGWWALALWMIMAFTSLTKGLVGFVLPLLVIGVYSLLGEGLQSFGNGVLHGTMEQRRVWLFSRCRWLFNLKTAVAAAIGLALYVSPFAISAILMDSKLGLSKVWSENVVQYFAPFDNLGPVYLYSYAIFELMAPWCAFLPAALMQIHCKSRDRRDRFSLAYFWATFFLFTFPGARRDYYLLPILPAASMMIARLLTSPSAELDRRARALMNLGFIALAVVALSSGPLALIPVSMRPGVLRQLPVVPDRETFGLIWVVMVASIVYAVKPLEPKKIAVSVSVIAYLVLFYVHLVALPAVKPLSGEKAFAQTVREKLGGDLSQLVSYKLSDPALWFYLGTRGPITVYEEENDLLRQIQQNPNLWVISREREFANLRLASSVITHKQEFYWDQPTHWQEKYVLFRPGDTGSSAATASVGELAKSSSQPMHH